MQIKIFHNTEGAKNAEGLAVLIDVFRAFTTECYVMTNGADKIIPVGDLKIAYQLKSVNPDFVLMGEQRGEIPKGFDFGNSPYQIRDVDFNGKTVIHISSAGTKGMTNATKASEIITGSFVNIQAVIGHIKVVNPDIVSLICTGTANETIRDEDALCAEFIKNSLLGKPTNFNEIKMHTKDGGYIDRFLDPNIPKFPAEDVDYCLALNKFNFVLKSSPYQENLIQLTKLLP